MTKLVLNIDKLVIDSSDLELLEALMAKGSRFVSNDYNHRVAGNYIEYLDPTQTFACTSIQILDSGKAAVMEMYYDEHVKKN